MRFPGGRFDDHVGCNAGKVKMRDAHIAKAQFQRRAMKTADPVLVDNEFLALGRDGAHEFATPPAEVERTELMRLAHQW